MLDNQNTPNAPIDLDPKDNSQLIDLNAPGVVSSPSYSDKYAQKRALMTQVASRGDIKFDDAYSRIQAGNEAQTQRYLAQKEQLRLEQTRNDFINEYVKEKGKSGTAVTPQELEGLRGISAPAFASEESLNTALEKQFARNIMSSSVAANPNIYDYFKGSVDENPEVADGLLASREAYIAKTRIAEKFANVASKAQEDQSWMGWAGDVGKTLVPGYSWYKKQNLVGPVSGLLPGENLRDQIAYLYTLPTEQFESTLRQAVEGLMKDNKELADEFARAVVSYPTMSRSIDNALGLLDLQTGTEIVGMVGKRIVKGATKKQLAKNALDDVAEAAANPRSTMPDIPAAAGNIDEAAAQQAAKSVVAKNNLGKTEAVQEVFDATVPSITNPKGFFQGPSNLAKGQALQLEKNLAESGELLTKAYARPWMVNRLDEGADTVRAAVDKAFSDLQALNRVDINNNVLDQTLSNGNISKYKYTANTEEVMRTNKIEIHIGDNQAGLFTSPDQAETFARTRYNLKDGDYTVNQQGGGFYITVQRDLDESIDAVRKAYATTEDTKTPASLMNRFFGLARSADALLSRSANQSRKISVNAAEEMKAFIEEATKPLSEYLSKKELPFSGRVTNYEKLERILNVNRETNSWFKNVNELEQAWYKEFRQFPSEKDIQAYYITKQISDFDYMVRNIDVYRDKARQGMMSMEIKITGQDGNLYSKAFEGKIVDDIPNRPGYRVLMVSDNGDVELINPFRDLNAEGRTALFNKIKEDNMKIVKTFATRDEVLAKYVTAKYGPNDNGSIDFVVSRNFRASQLNINQLPYNPHHRIYESRAFVKQPQIGAILDRGKYAGHGYRGDTTIAAMRQGKDAEAFANDLNIAREMYKKNDPQFDNFVSSKLGMTPGELKQAFNSGKFNVDQPFFVAKDTEKWTNKNVLKEGTVDFTSSAYSPEAEMLSRFTSEKGMDLYDFRLGSQNNPVYMRQEARTLDPLRSIQRGLSDVIDSVAFGDYKIRSANEWIEDFGDLLQASQDQVRSAPLYHLMNPVFKANAEAIDPVRFAAAKQSSIALKHLVSQPSSVQTSIEFAKAKISEFIYDKLGAKAADKFDDMTLYTTKDPLSYMRAIATHSKLGLFNPAQFFLQVQNLGNMAAISPKHALAAYRDAVAMTGLRANANESIVNFVANQSKNPWFKQSWADLKDSGFLNIGGNMALVDAITEVSITSSRIGKALDFGMVFFKEGEIFNRLGAWNIAYREWKTANPALERLDDAGRRWVMERADNLTTNMTRASNAALQNGFGSIPLQFFTYHWRLLEQVWTSGLGKGPFTKAEMLRMLSYNGMMYGIPVGVLGPITGIWPWYESFEKAAQERGINFDSNVVSKTMMRGLYEQAAEALVGRQFNVNERFGPGGMPTLKDLIEGDKGISVLFGVSGSVLGEMYKATDPAMYHLANVFKGPEEKTPITAMDIVDTFKSVTTINNATKAWMLYNYGTYTTRTGVPIETGKTGEAGDAWMQMLGITPREMSKFYARKDVLKAQNEAIKEITKEVQVHVGRAFKAETEKEAEQHFKRARILIEGAGTLTETQRISLMKNVIKNFKEDQKDSVNRKWALSAPNSEILERRLNQLQEETRTNGR